VSIVSKLVTDCDTSLRSIFTVYWIVNTVLLYLLALLSILSLIIPSKQRFYIFVLTPKFLALYPLQIGGQNFAKSLGAHVRQQ